MITQTGGTAKAVLKILNQESASRLKKKPASQNILGSTRAALSGLTQKPIKAMQEESFEVQYNPASMQISEMVSEQGSNAADGLNPQNNVGGNCTRNVSLELVFSREDGMEPGFVKKKVEMFLAVMMKSPDRRISFSWGNMECIGSVTSLSVSYEMFDESGNPLFGRVKMTIREELESMEKRFDKADAVRKDKLRSTELE